MGCCQDSQETQIDDQKKTPLTDEEREIQERLEKHRAEFGFEGKLMIIGLDGYEDARFQYASTSELMLDMSPGMILYAKGEADVVKALKVCRDKGMKMAIRTGGHQYCGYSSTSPENMQVDLSEAFTDYAYDATKNRLVCGPSFPLGDWAVKNHENGFYLPMGMCWNVHLGGHVHTGGWGMVARSHGILADHCLAFSTILADGSKARVVKPETEDYKQAEADGKLHEHNDDLYFAVLGGSIGGSFGVVSQFEFEPIRDADHPNSACYQFFWLKTEENTRKVAGLVQKYTEMCENGEIPSDYEFMLTVTGAGNVHMLPEPSAEAMIRLEHADKDVFGKVMMPPLIQMWMCYTNKGGAEAEFDDQWFEKFVEHVGEPIWTQRKKKTAVSYGLSHMFIMKAEREMEYPYVKRARTSSKIPVNFADVYTDRMQKVTGGFGVLHGVHLCSQMQIYAGGAIKSQEATSYTSYSWRDMVLAMSHDAFYDHTRDKNAYKHAIDWEEGNDEAFVGEGGAYSEQDKRMFAYTWGEREIEKVWQYYYDSEEKYQRIRAIKTKVDPDAIFNASPMGIPPL